MSNPALRVHPKFLRLAAMLNISQALTRGLLECLWDAVSHSGDPDIGNATGIETAACWTGEPGQFCAALLECGCGRAGFIEEIPDKPGLYRLHDLLDHASAEQRRKWIRQHERNERGSTISEIRRAAANARWAKKRAADANANAKTNANVDAKPCKPMQTETVCMPPQTVPEPQDSGLKPTLTHYIPTFAEVQTFISDSGLRGDAFDFIREYRQMPPKGPDQPDRWRFHLNKWARQKLAQWNRAARERRRELIASCPR